MGRSGKLKLSGETLFFLAFAIPRSTVTKTDGTYSGLRLAFHNFLTSHSFALTSSIPPLSSQRPIYIHYRSNVLPQIEVAKVIFFFLVSCRALQNGLSAKMI